MEYIKTREDLLKILPKNSVGIEIGVFRGEFAQQILDIVSPSMLYLIDPWQGMIESGDKNGKNIQYINGDVYYNQEILPKFNLIPNVKVLREFSKILTIFPDEIADWIYIDADHQYNSVKYDLEISYSKVKQNGYILGHDYNIEICPGVVRAVDEFCQKNSLIINLLTQDGCPSYLIEKL